MKVEMLAFSASDAANAKAAMKLVGEYFSDTVGAIERFRLFNSSRDFFSGMAEAFTSADIIVSAATVDSFLEQKWAMLKALSLGSEINRAIVSEISQNGRADDSAVKKHSIMPKDATVFCTADALYSGFAVKKGKQTLIYLPLDTELLPGLLDDCVLPYFTDIRHQKQTAPAASPAAPASSPSVQTVKQPMQQHKAKEKKDSFSEATAALADKGISVAVAAMQTSVYVRNRVSSDPANGYLYTFTDCDDERNENESLKNYAARISDTVRLKSKAEVGAVISNVYTSGGADGQMFIYVAVSDKDHARVKKVLAKENESAGGLVDASTKILYKMLLNYAQTDGMPPEEARVTELEGVEDDTDGDQLPTATQTKSTGLKVIIGIAIALIMCLLIGFFFKDVRAFFFDDSVSDTQAVSETTGTEPAVEAMMMAEFNELETASDFAEIGGHAVAEEMKMREAPTVEQEVLTTEAAAPEASSKETTTEATTEKSTTAATTAQTTTATSAPTTEKVKETTEKKTTEATEKVTEKEQEVTTEKTTAQQTEADTETTTESTVSSGTFTFTAYGYGHGVGMSQLGALSLGSTSGSNWSYDKILSHYYPGTALSTDSSMPVLIYMNSSPVLLRTFLARVTNAEIGSGCKQANLEGVKAQIVAIYTFVKYDIDKGDSSFVSGQIAYNTNEPSDFIFSAVDSVLGQYLSYGGKTAFTPFYSSSAGKTTSSSSVWGGTPYPYLLGGVSSPESVPEKTITISAEQMKECVESYNSGASDKNKITLSGKPSQWIEIISHDGARGNVGYVSSIRVGNQTMSGNAFRRMIGNAKLKSHCFSFSYSD